MEIGHEWCIAKCIQMLTEDDSPSSSSSSSDDELEVLQVLDLVKNKKIKFHSFNGCTDLNTTQYTETEFISHFRIKRALYCSLCNMFRKSLHYQKMSLSRQVHSPEKHLAIFLWFAGHKACSIQDVGNRFNISKAAVHLILKRVIGFFCQKSSNWIRWPNQDEQGETSKYFHSKYGFPNVIGCIDTSRVAIDALEDERITPTDKGGQSLGVQVICNEKKKIINVYVASSGEVYNSGMLGDSPINNKLQQLDRGNYLLGDSSYPCKTYLMTPYKDDDNLSDRQIKYNKALHTCRTHITDCLNALKCRFPGVCCCKLRDIKTFSEFITVCCILHNLADEDDLDILKQIEDSECNYCINNDFGLSVDDNAGLKLREQICLRHF